LEVSVSNGTPECPRKDQHYSPATSRNEKKLFSVEENMPCAATDVWDEF